MYLKIFEDNLESRNYGENATYAINQENNISEQKVVKEKRQSSRRSPKFQKKRYNEEEDTFSAEVNKKYLWAEKR